jgi:CubicO group peptidase (beta-lactamase class C family)
MSEESSQDLEASIAAWRKRLLAAGLDTPELLDELESHLRDGIEAQLGDGLSEEQAFTSAAQKIGVPAEIREEFVKAAAEQEERLWRRGQISLLVLAGAVQLAIAGGLLGSSEMLPHEKLSALAALGISSCLAAVVRSGHRFFPAIAVQRKRQAAEVGIGLVIYAVAGVMARIFLVDEQASFGAFVVKMLWVCCPPLAVYFGIIGGFEAASRRALPGRKTTTGAALLLGCLLCLSLTAQRTDAADPAPEAAELDASLAKQLPADGAGDAILLARDGHVLFSHGYGWADREHQIPVTDQTRFRIGSVTKQFTAAAILKLADAGKLSVEDPLEKYFPGYPGGGAITLRHLLNHTSGLHNFTDHPGFSAQVTKPVNETDLVASFRNDPPDFKPGEEFRYSNSGYVLLGMIVEKVAGLPLGDYWQREFFGPLGMQATGVWMNATPPEPAAKGYAADAKKLTPAQDWDMSWAGGAGDLYSTVGDLWRWTEALHGGRVISPAALQTMTAEVTVAKKETLALRYGMGLYRTEVGGLAAIGHNGGLPGYLSSVMWLPEEKVTVVVLGNAMPAPTGGNPAELLPVVARAFLGKEIAAHAPQIDPNADPNRYADYAGRYDYKTAFQEITVADGHLYAQLTGQPKFEVFPSGPDAFFYKAVEAKLAFQRDANGTVNAVIHSQNGASFTAPRLMPEDTIAATLSDAALENLTGKYRYSPAAVLTVTREGRQLYAQLTGQPKFPIFPKSAHEFFWKVVEASVEFIAGPDGKIVKVIHHQGGTTLDAPREE